jgi:hypothetical protein
MSVASTPVEDHCVLQNPVFTRLGEARFRRAESDGAPVMVVQLGDGFAALPLRSLQREFDIKDDSHDGRMLGKIAESLDFVAGLTFGDPLPREVVTGEASWQASPKHQQIAATKLRLQLLDWLDPAAAAAEVGRAAAAERLESDPKLRAAVQAAFERAASELGLPNAQAVVELVADVAGELSFIEALRDGLLGRVRAMVLRLDGLSNGTLNHDRKTTLARIRRLAHLALEQIAGRFVEVDGQTREVMSTLRNAEAHRTFIRSHRDWLYRSSRAWSSILAEWDAASMSGLDDAAWQRLNRTYQFLAPRFMPVQEWFSPNTQPHMRREKPMANAVVW